MNNHVYFKTDRFNTSEVKPHFINDRCFGEDLGAWFASRLAERDVLCRPLIQEDWGWSLPVSLEHRRFYINIGVADGPSGPTNPPVWLAWVEARAGLMARILGRTSNSQQRALCDHLNAILAAEPTISAIEWSSG